MTCSPARCAVVDIPGHSEILQYFSMRFASTLVVLADLMVPPLAHLERWLLVLLGLFILKHHLVLLPAPVLHATPSAGGGHVYGLCEVTSL